ncbi:MAG: hypothetical protein ACOZBW_01705, partial [Thermodesulfobacteriota bacterium]
IGDASDTVSGRVFVVLEGKARRMVIPETALKDGAPVDTGRGQYFSIARYKAVTMMARIENPIEFNTATAFVFSADGGLLYKTVFPVRIVQETPAAESRVEETVGQ